MKYTLMLWLLLTSATVYPQQKTVQQGNKKIFNAQFVNPFIGTGGHGHTYPGATLPFGMVQLSPDTRPDGYMDWDGCGGYHYSDSVIYGFSHTHLSGTGVADLCDVLIMPMSDRFSFEPQEYRSPFRKATEQADVGDASVFLLSSLSRGITGETLFVDDGYHILGSLAPVE